MEDNQAHKDPETAPIQNVQDGKTTPIANSDAEPRSSDLASGSSSPGIDQESQSKSSERVNASSATFPAWQGFVGPLLDNIALQITFRLIYIPLSSYGAYKMIQEQTEPIAYGWRAWVIAIGFVMNAIFALLASNTELYATWSFLRKVTNRHYLLTIYESYPHQAHRLAGIAICAYVFNSVFKLTWSRPSLTALVVSIFLVASDTPSGRALLWTRERRDKTSLAIGFAVLTFVGGWRVYRWPVLLAAYLNTMALLATDINPMADKIALHQFWLACGALPSIVIVSAYRPQGLPWYSTLVLLCIMLSALRQRTSSDMATIRYGSIATLTALLEIYARGFTYSFFVQAVGLLLYVVNLAA